MAEGIKLANPKLKVIGFAGDGDAYGEGIEQLKKIFKEAINHKGFALIDILQVCVTFYNMYEYYDKRTYELKDYNPSDYHEALDKIREWNYHADSKIALGVLYKKAATTFEERLLASKKDAVDIDSNIEKVLAKAV